MLKNEIDAWLAANVQVQKAPATVAIHSCCRPELVEHLTYRYPNVKSIRIRDYLWYPNSNSTWNNDDFGRILDAIKEIPPPRNLL